MVITLPSRILEESQTPYPTQPLLWCWQLQMAVNPSPLPNYFAQIVANPSPITITGGSFDLTFYPFPVSQSPIEQSASGELPQMTLSIDNRSRFLMRWVDSSNGFLGRQAVAYLVNPLEPTIAQSVRFSFYVVAAEASAETLTFRLELPNLFNRRTPEDRFNPQNCRWRFGSNQCGYIVNATSGFTTCPKTLGACTLRGDDEVARGLPRRHPRRFGGFRGIPVARR